MDAVSKLVTNLAQAFTFGVLNCRDYTYGSGNRYSSGKSPKRSVEPFQEFFDGWHIKQLCAKGGG